MKSGQLQESAGSYKRGDNYNKVRQISSINMNMKLMNFKK